MVKGERTHRAEHKDHGGQHLQGHVGDLGKAAHTAVAQQAHEDIGHQQTEDDDIHLIGRVAEQQRTGGNAQHHQRAQHDGGACVAGDTEGQQRDQGAAGHGVICGLGGGNTLQAALTKILAVLGDLFHLGIGRPASDIAAGAGDRANQRTDHGAGQNGAYTTFDILPGGQHTSQLGALPIEYLTGLIAFHVDQALRECVQRDQDHDIGQTAQQVGPTEGEAAFRRQDIHTHVGDHQTHHHGQQALDQIVGGDTGHDAQTEHSQSEVLGCAKVQGELCQQRGGNEQAQGGENTAESGSKCRHTQRTASLAPQRHGIAVKAGGGGVGGAGGVDQDRGDGTAVNAAAEDTQQAEDPCIAGHGKGKRDHDGQRHGTGKTGHGSAENSEEGAEQHQKKILPRQKLTKSEGKASNIFQTSLAEDNAHRQFDTQKHLEYHIDKHRHAY